MYYLVPNTCSGTPINLGLNRVAQMPYYERFLLCEICLKRLILKEVMVTLVKCTTNEKYLYSFSYILYNTMRYKMVILDHIFGLHTFFIKQVFTRHFINFPKSLDRHGPAWLTDMPYCPVDE